MSDFTPIPDYPEYSISPLGQVRSERSGLILSHDARGRVKIRAGKKYPSFFVGELLAMAGCLSSSPALEHAPAPLEAQAPVEDPRTDELERRLGLARRVNAHLLALVAQLRKEIVTLESGKRKKAKLPSDLDEDPFLQPLNFDELPS